MVADDFRVSVFGKWADTYFYIGTIFCFIIFTIELLLSCYAKKDYLFSFFFYLDFVSTLSLLFDIGWITDLIFNTESDDGTNSQNAAQLAKAAQASRIGTRAARVIRIVRLIRLIRIIKLYKAIQQQNEVHSKETEKAKKEVIKRAKTRRMVSLSPSPFYLTVRVNLTRDISRARAACLEVVDSQEVTVLSYHKPRLLPPAETYRATWPTSTLKLLAPTIILTR